LSGIISHIMIIYKFGGASVRNSGSVMKLAEIVGLCTEPLVVVISAMGKTTNRLEAILDEGLRNSWKSNQLLEELRDEHLSVVEALIRDNKQAVSDEVERLLSKIPPFIRENCHEDYNFLYDQVVSTGELLSTKIVSAYLTERDIINNWIDIREVIKTNDNFRDAVVDYALSEEKSKNVFNSSSQGCFVTQGFIGSGNTGHTTTLGREGSDYTAALLANFLNASGITLWKDVPGIFNADPALFNKVEQIPSLSYQEVIELTYYGAKVIHPKTVKPLYDKEIPLVVKSFNDPSKPGTVVEKSSLQSRNIPFIILKEKQVLISISNKDLSFVSEINVSELFRLLNDFRLKANLVQHSAISFSVSVDTPKGKEITDLVAALRSNFRVLYNEGLELVTIRNYSEEVIKEMTRSRKIMVEQRSRQTVQFLLA